MLATTSESRGNCVFFVICIFVRLFFSGLLFYFHSMVFRRLKRSFARPQKRLGDWGNCIIAAFLLEFGT
jgi:hypothetical protein